MRRVIFLLGVSLCTCSSSPSQSSDASAMADFASGVDAAVPDAASPDASCPPTLLLLGGTDVAAQGWSTIMQAPATVSYGTDYVHLQTSTNSGASSGGQLLLRYPNAVEVGKPFKLQVLMLVESVNAHNTLDSAAAIMGSLTGNFGSSTERGQMIYLDSGKIGWADDSQSFSTSVKDNTYHTYVLSVDASNVARVSVDGNPALMRNNFVTNGTIAIGDQTNDSNVDSALRIKSVSKLCP